jgi:branched-chain amino acid transport system substrate-binding protein
MKHRRGIALGALAAMAVAACGSSNTTSGSGAATDSATSASGEPYQIGLDSDLSAQFAANGTGLRTGFLAYTTWVNQHGGVNGHPLNVTVLDDAAATARGLGNLTQLITQNHISGMAGGLLSNICGAQAQLAAQNKVPLLCNAVGGDLLNPVQPYVFTSRIAQLSEARPMMDFVKTVVSVPTPKVAIVTFSSAASNSLHDALKSIANSRGWPVVAEATVPQTAVDVSAQAATVSQSKADVVVGALFDPLAVLFVRALASQGVSTPFIDYDGASYQALSALKNTNYYVNSSITMTGEGDGSGLAQYRQVLQAASVKPTDSFINVGYVQGLIMVEALKKCGFPCSGQQLQAALEKLNLDTGGVTSGPVQFSSSSHEALHAMSIYVWDSAANTVKAAKANLTGGSS